MTVFQIVSKMVVTVVPGDVWDSAGAGRVAMSSGPLMLAHSGLRTSLRNRMIKALSARKQCGAATRLKLVLVAAGCSFCSFPPKVPFSKDPHREWGVE